MYSGQAQGQVHHRGVCECLVQHGDRAVPSDDGRRHVIYVGQVSGEESVDGWSEESERR